MNILDHNVLMHAEWAVWRRLAKKLRWTIAYRYADRRVDLCWCQMVSVVLDAEWDQDQRARKHSPDVACGCHANLLSKVFAPQANWHRGNLQCTCYCPEWMAEGIREVAA